MKPERPPAGAILIYRDPKTGSAGHCARVVEDQGSFFRVRDAAHAVSTTWRVPADCVDGWWPPRTRARLRNAAKMRRLA